MVPGITAALGAAASSGLPLTHRRLAQSVTFVTGHDNDRAAPDWRFFANPQHTVVFYMGVAQLPGIVARLRAAGAQADHPVAIIERATLPEAAAAARHAGRYRRARRRRRTSSRPRC